MSARRKAGRDPMDSITVHIGDWRTSTTIARLGRYLESVYLELLMHQWLSEGDGLPADPDELRTMVRLNPAEWAKFWRIAEPKFPVDPDGQRRNPRTHAEWQHCSANRELARRKGQKGGQTAAQKRSPSGSPATSPATPAATSPASSPSPSPSPTTSVEVVARPATPSSGTDEPGLSARFADARHREAYQRARRSHRVPMALDATLEAMAEGMAGPGGKPCTWHQLGVAILEAQAAQRDLTAQTLRNFAAKAPTAPETASTPATDAPGTIRDTAGRLVWHPGQADARPSDDEITGNGWRVAA